MKQRNVGKSGLRVSEIGLGCNNFGDRNDAAESTAIIHRALDLGVTLFDTAPIYGAEWGASEKVLKEALGPRRKDVTIVTKFGFTPNVAAGPDTSRAGIINSLEASLQRLGTDYVDVLMLHWRDMRTPMQETLRALDDVVRAGKVRYIGCCNLPAWQVVESQWISKSEHLHEFIFTQDEYSLAQRKADQDLLPALAGYNMGFMPYAPLGNGLLTGKFSKNSDAPAESRLAKNTWNMGDRYLTPEKLELVDRLSRFAEERGHTLLELAISWLLANPMVCSVIAGATRVEQLEQNLAARNWQLSADELEAVDQICAELS